MKLQTDKLGDVQALVEQVAHSRKEQMVLLKPWLRAVRRSCVLGTLSAVPVSRRWSAASRREQLPDKT